MRVLLCYKNFAANQNISHIGLGVSALNTAKVLKAHGVAAEVHAILGARDIDALLKSRPDATHVVISAPWIQAADIAGILLRPWPNVEFSINCHSNVGFLQADPNGVRLIRQYADLEQGSLNLKLAANSRKGTAWLRDAYQCPCQNLPNLYYLDYSVISKRPLWRGGIMRIGAFGATRPLKNLMSAAGAALQIANAEKADVEFWVNGGRQEGGGNTVISAMREMLSGLGNIQLMQANWASWPEFRDLVRRMHLLINASYTESFNMVTADGVAEGVPSVTSDAIDWVPSYWHAPVDDTSSIARVGRHLITKHDAGIDGFKALEQHNTQGLDAWGAWMQFQVRYKSLSPDPYLI